MISKPVDRNLFSRQKGVLSINRSLELSRQPPKGHSSATIGFIAAKLKFRTSTLINAFKQAGILGLTSNHVIDQAQWEQLYNFTKYSKEKASELYRDKTIHEDQILLVKSINSHILEQLARRPQLLYNLAPRKFEELVAKLLEDQGCEIELTKRTRDGGYDLIGKINAPSTNLIFLAECKRYAPDNKVGVDIVRSLYGVTEARKLNLGLIITTSTFTQDAQKEKLLIGPRIDLKEYAHLCEWLAPYRSESKKNAI